MQFVLSDFYDLMQGLTNYQYIQDSRKDAPELSPQELVEKLRIRKV